MWMHEGRQGPWPRCPKSEVGSYTGRHCRKQASSAFQFTARETKSGTPENTFSILKSKPVMMNCFDVLMAVEGFSSPNLMNGIHHHSVREVSSSHNSTHSFFVFTFQYTCIFVSF